MKTQKYLKVDRYKIIVTEGHYVQRFSWSVVSSVLFPSVNDEFQLTPGYVDHWGWRSWMSISKGGAPLQQAKGWSTHSGSWTNCFSKWRSLSVLAASGLGGVILFFFCGEARAQYDWLISVPGSSFVDNFVLLFWSPLAIHPVGWPLWPRPISKRKCMDEYFYLIWTNPCRNNNYDKSKQMLLLF